MSLDQIRLMGLWDSIDALVEGSWFHEDVTAWATTWPQAFSAHDESQTYPEAIKTIEDWSPLEINLNGNFYASSHRAAIEEFGKFRELVTSGDFPIDYRAGAEMEQLVADIFPFEEPEQLQINLLRERVELLLMTSQDYGWIDDGWKKGALDIELNQSLCWVRRGTAIRQGLSSSVHLA